jgi:hypothetical protein
LQGNSQKIKKLELEENGFVNWNEIYFTQVYPLVKDANRDRIFQRSLFGEN